MNDRDFSKEHIVTRVFSLKPHLVLLALVLVSGLSFAAPRWSAQAQAVDSPLITDANQARVASGLDPLLPNGKLAAAAQAKAEDMLQKDYFEHYGPNGETPWEFIVASGYHYHKAGENLAMGFNDLSTVNDAWLASPAHRDNLLNSDFRDIGIGLARGVLSGKEVTVIVEMFGSP